MTWREFRKGYWNLTFWLAIILGTLGFLFALGGQIYTKFLEPDPIETKYAYQVINKDYYFNAYLYKKKSDAYKYLEKYEKNEIVTVEFHYSNIIELKPDEKVLVIK